jgi:hypothetical protein
LILNVEISFSYLQSHFKKLRKFRCHKILCFKCHFSLNQNPKSFLIFLYYYKLNVMFLWACLFLLYLKWLISALIFQVSLFLVPCSKQIQQHLKLFLIWINNWYHILIITEYKKSLLQIKLIVNYWLTD